MLHSDSHHSANNRTQVTESETDSSAVRELSELKSWIKKASEVCREASKGNLEARILGYDRDDEMGEIVHGINNLLDITDAFVREAKASLEYASKGKFFRRVLLRGLPGTFRHAAQVINSANDEMARNAKGLTEAKERRLMLADQFEAAIKGIVGTVASASTELSATAQNLSHNAASTTEQSVAVAAAAQEMSVNVQRVAAATEELTNTVAEVGRQVTESSKAGLNAVQEASRTKDIAEGLSAASQRIGGVVKLISQIAGQTNLLALNATIEAARAGEAGKGFAVVASEVKALARQTADATEEIQREIMSVQSISADASKAIGDIAKTIQSMQQISEAIEVSVSEQREATQEICGNIHQTALGTQNVSNNISGVTIAAQDTSSGSNEVLLASSELSRQAEGLRAAVEEFLVSVRRG